MLHLSMVAFLWDGPWRNINHFNVGFCFEVSGVRMSVVFIAKALFISWWTRAREMALQTSP
jgi:hypothetical protein